MQALISAYMCMLHTCIVYMYVCIPVKDYQVHLPVLKLGGVLLGTSVLPDPPVVLEFIFLGGLRGRVLLLR